MKRQDEKYRSLLNNVKPAQVNIHPDTVNKYNELVLAGDFVQCPCCKKIANNVRGRPLYKDQINGLISLANHGTKYNPSALSDFAKLKHWGFIENPTGEKGAWVLTEIGHDFIYNNLEVPLHAVIKNNECLGFGDEMITIAYFLGGK